MLLLLVFVFGWFFFFFLLSVYLVPLRAKIPKRNRSLSLFRPLNFSLGIPQFIAFGALCLNSVVFAPSAYNMNCADNSSMGHG